MSHHCDHVGTLVKVEPPAPAGILLWCNCCGAFNVLGEWRHPSLVGRLLDVLRALRMTEEVQWRQELFDAALAGIDSPTIQTAPRYVPAEQYEAAVRDRDTMCATLTIAQDAGSKLVEENRLLRARVDRFGV